jgi:hypothetical protein
MWNVQFKYNNYFQISHVIWTGSGAIQFPIDQPSTLPLSQMAKWPIFCTMCIHNYHNWNGEDLFILHEARWIEAFHVISSQLMKHAHLRQSEVKECNGGDGTLPHFITMGHHRSYDIWFSFNHIPLHHYLSILIYI